MKIAVECKSVLLQKAVENFLGKHLSSLKHGKIVVRDFPSDDERTFLIFSDGKGELKKPFSKSQLLLALENRYKELELNENEESEVIKDKQPNFEILQKRIEMLTQEYQKNILEAIRAFYG